MDKRIVKLSREPFRVGLEDRSCSIFIDPKVGTILIDEGEGEDRLNGAVMYPDKAPIFSVATEDGKGNVLLLNYSGFRLVVGTVKDAAETQEWASSANRFLATKAGQTTGSSTATLKSPPPPDQTSPESVPISFPVANGAVRKETTNGPSKVDLPSSTDHKETVRSPTPANPDAPPTSS
jgi:hypothetical protein